MCSSFITDQCTRFYRHPARSNSLADQLNWSDSSLQPLDFRTARTDSRQHCSKDIGCSGISCRGTTLGSPFKQSWRGHVDEQLCFFELGKFSHEIKRESGLNFGFQAMSVGYSEAAAHTYLLSQPFNVALQSVRHATASVARNEQELACPKTSSMPLKAQANGRFSLFLLSALSPSTSIHRRNWSSLLCPSSQSFSNTLATSTRSS